MMDKNVQLLFWGAGLSLSSVGLVWMITTLITVDKRTEVMSVKIEQNNEMLKPLWEDFIRRSATYDNKTIKHGEASVKVWK